MPISPPRWLLKQMAPYLTRNWEWLHSRYLPGCEMLNFPLLGFRRKLLQDYHLSIPSVHSLLSNRVSGWRGATREQQHSWLHPLTLTSPLTQQNRRVPWTALDVQPLHCTEGRFKRQVWRRALSVTDSKDAAEDRAECAALRLKGHASLWSTIIRFLLRCW